MPEAAAIWVPIDQLKPWSENPRKNEAAIAKVAASIKRFGFASPIIARETDSEIIAGHTRYQAAKSLGLERVPVRFLPLDPADAHLLAIADNKLGEIAEWNDEGLGALLSVLSAEDHALAGFDEDEVGRILGDLEAERLGAVEEDEDAVVEPPKEPESKPGELYELGPHRLLCGDSTRLEHIELALGQRQADMLFTDPPYGIAYSGRGEGTSKGIENDDLDPERLREFLTDCFAGAGIGLRHGAAIYVCHSDQKIGLRQAFERALLDNEFHVAGCLVWVKNQASMGWQDYRGKHEPILYGWRKGGEHRRVEDRAETTVWEVKRDAASKYEHPTQKPIELPMRAIKNSSMAGEVVLDLFGGSGSTLIAAAKTGRMAVLIEKDPGYCDVIRRRWEKWHAKTQR